MEFAIKIFIAVGLNLLENFYGSFQLKNYCPPDPKSRLFGQCPLTKRARDLTEAPRFYRKEPVPYQA
jgi:hypothetical protein